ncbi:MAG: flagellar motor protein MotB [Myxococcales bacterium]|nr:flagellar motor protein MotB [Myxococcales bacterium]
MAKREKQPEKGADPTAWMASFADLLTNLLVFFVLLLSMNAVDNQKLQESLTFFKGALGVLEMGSATGLEIKNPVFTNEKGEPMFLDGAHLLQIYADIFEHSERAAGRLGRESTDSDAVHIYEDERGIHIRLVDQGLFEPGDAILKLDHANLLRRIAHAVGGSPFYVEIEGHTDSRPLGADAAYRSNWELATARAAAVLDFMNDVHPFDPERVKVVGYGPSRPISAEDTAEGRRRNRRIEILLAEPER